MSNAGLARRLAAIVYDSLLVIALMFLTATPFIAVRGGEPVPPGENLLLRLALIGVTYAFFVGFWTTKGRTLGMQSWGLQVETADAGRPGIGQASVRFAVAILSWLALGLGFLWQLWDRDRLTWHDRLSGTRLVFYPRESRRK